jgi:hypothetical protein
MDTLIPSKVVAPFGKINLWRMSDGGKKVRAYILVEQQFEQAKTGVAIDGSASMRQAYGYPSGLMGMFSNKRSGTNVVASEAARFCGYLASRDVDNKTAIIYWGTGGRSQDIEVIGDLTEAQAKAYDFGGPKQFGGGSTALLPAVRYFVERFSTSQWGLYLFVTDGAINDLEAVKKYSTELAQAIEAGKRPPLKLVLIGVGAQVEAKQMIALDDLETGTSVDLWDHKIAAEMHDLGEIITEVVDETMVLADSAIVRDAQGALVKDYRDTGLPALLEFDLPNGAAEAFVLEVNGQVIRQPLP